MQSANTSRKPPANQPQISDLNNVPLVSGVSLIKWHLPHSIHREHKGQTQKCPILNHRVEYSYSKVIPVRIGIDRNSSLVECPIEFEVVQEFSAAGAAGAAGRDEKITLGTIRLNLSEFVEESEGILRHGDTHNALKEALTWTQQKSDHHRKRSSLSNVVPSLAESSPRSSQDADRPPTDVQDGVVRRYLMQESKINSTLRISILLVQVDGERNYVAPPPKSTPVFGGIAGFMAGDAFEPVDPGANTPGHAPSSFTGKSRDMFEVQDMYRRSLAASWASQPGELPAHSCIEDLFAGGEGFAVPSKSNARAHPHTHANGHSRHHTAVAGPDRGASGVDNTNNNNDNDASPDRSRQTNNPSRRTNNPHSSSASVSDEEEEEEEEQENGDTMGTLRPRDLARLRHLREQSVVSDRTVLGSSSNNERGDRSGGSGNGPTLREPFPAFPSSSSFHHRREESKITHDGGGLRSRSSSLVSLATTTTTVGSEWERGREAYKFKRAREVEEGEVREDLVAWSVRGGGL